MEAKEIRACCLKKPGACLTHPFGPDSAVVKVENRIFAQIFVLKGVPSLTLNCDAVSGRFYRELLPGVIVRGCHCPPVQQPYFNTMPLDKVEKALLLEMVDLSHNTVVGRLPKYKRERINVNASGNS